MNITLKEKIEKIKEELDKAVIETAEALKEYNEWDSTERYI